MTVFKNFLKLTLSFRFMILSYFIIFALLFIPNFLYTIKEKDASFRPTKINILIDNNSDSAVSKIFEEYFKDNNLTFAHMSESDKKMEVMLSTYDIALTIPKDFEKKVMEGNQKAIEFFSKSDYVNVNYILSDINNIIGYLQSYNLNVDKTLQMLNNTANIQLVEKEKNKTTIEYALNGASYVLMSIIMLSTGGILINYQDSKLIKRINISSYSMSKYTKELVLGELVTSAIFLILLFAIIFGIAPSSSYIFIKQLLSFVIFIFAVLGMTNIIVEFTPNNRALTAAVNVISLTLAFTSGVFIPKEFTSPVALTISKFFPLYYVSENINLTEMNWEYFKNLLIIALMAIAYYTIFIVIKKKKKLMQYQI